MSAVAMARLVREELDDSLKMVETGLIHGADSWDAYQFALGTRRGLLQAIAAVDEVTKRFDEQN